jgi:hypothetical protein
MLAALFSSWLVALGVIVSESAAYQTNALVVGTLATVLAAFSTYDRRARYGAAVLAVWTAFMPFVVSATLVETVLNVSWATVMFPSLVGPFVERPVSTWSRPAVQTPARSVEHEREPELPLAA